jgi:hypothetical protein
LDGNKLRNNAGNLEWGTTRQNADDKIKHGSCKGIRNGAARPTVMRVMRLRRQYRKTSITALQKANSDISPAAIYAAVSGRTWKHLPGAVRHRQKHRVYAT